MRQDERSLSIDFQSRDWCRKSASIFDLISKDEQEDEDDRQMRLFRLSMKRAFSVPLDRSGVGRNGIGGYDDGSAVVGSRNQNYGIAVRAGADSYFFMNRLAAVASLFVAGLLFLTGCASNDDPFLVHPPGTTDPGPPVAGATTPPRGSSEGGWNW